LTTFAPWSTAHTMPAATRDQGAAPLRESTRTGSRAQSPQFCASVAATSVPWPFSSAASVPGATKSTPGSTLEPAGSETPVSITATTV
jgi:hypothetical protein